MTWWAQRLWEINPAYLGAWVFWVIFSIVLHELAHGVAAIRCGDDTPIVTGHMTWNPLVHMGQTSLILFALCGLCWGMMPVNPSRFRGKYDDAYVAFAGPLVNLCLWVVCILASVIWLVYFKDVSNPLRENMFMFWTTGAMLNLLLFLFNLAPIPPLDGSRILANFSPPYERFLRTEAGAVASIIGAGVLFWFGGRYFQAQASDATSWTIVHGAALLRGAAPP